MWNSKIMVVFLNITADSVVTCHASHNTVISQLIMLVITMTFTDKMCILGTECQGLSITEASFLQSYNTV